jgi:hypothetical protein
MSVAESSMQIVLPRPRFAGKAVLIAVIAGVTWLAMMGGYVSSYVVGHPIELLPQKYSAYAMSDVAPTSYGTMEIAHADVRTDGDTLIAGLSLRMDNILNVGVEAPQVEELRLVDTNGNRVSRDVALAWNGPAFVPGQTTATIDITLAAPAGAGPVWLEYRKTQGQDPIRFALNTGASR